MTATIEVSHLTKKFGGRTAVDDVSFTVARGEIFGFLGPNGAGKTTTVRMLGTLVAPTSGSAVVAGVPLDRAGAAEIRRRVSVMPEAPGLYRRLTVRENLEFFARLYGLPDRDSRIRQALESVGLSDRAQDPTGSLSKGLRQRTALARSLLTDPEVLFLDEPTSGLDPAATVEVLNLIAGMRDKGTTVLLTTHRLDEAERLCDRVAIMNTSLRAVGKPSELRAQLFSRSLSIITAAPLKDPARVFTGVADVREWRDVTSGGPAGYLLTVSDPALAAPAVTRALVAAAADVLFIGESRHTLEDVYLQLAGGEAGEKPADAKKELSR